MVKPEINTVRSSAFTFIATVTQTEPAIKKQMNMELALRFIVFRNIPYKKGLDVHEYLDNGLIKLATDPSFSMEQEKAIFERTFVLLNRVLGKKAFIRWYDGDFKGKFLMSVFEVMAVGVSKNISQIEQMSKEKQDEFVRDKSKALWTDETFCKYSGAGISGTARLANLLPIAEGFLKP